MSSKRKSKESTPSSSLDSAPPTNPSSSSATILNTKVTTKRLKTDKSDTSHSSKPRHDDNSDDSQHNKNKPKGSKDAKHSSTEGLSSSGGSGSGSVSAVEVKELETVQEELDKFSKEAEDDMKEIELKFERKKSPLYCRRAALIEKVPDFWLECFMNMTELTGMLNGLDTEILHHLINLDITNHQRHDFTLSLNFSANNLFTDLVLTKTYHYNDDITVDSSPIHWKDPAIPTNNSESFFVTWFKDIDQLDFLGEVIREDLYKNPLAVYLRRDDDDDQDGQDNDDDNDNDQAEPDNDNDQDDEHDQQD